MTPVAGGYALNLALGFSLFSIISVFWFHYNKDARLYFTAQRLVLGSYLLVGFATFVLAAELINSNFDIDYVAHYTSLETPAVYKLTALWAGQEGSLLFWLFILSIYAGTVVIQNQRRNVNLMPWVLVVLSVVMGFFLVLTNFVANPFAPTDADFQVMNGNGLNPLLQNATMAIHPPTLYLGYIGFTVPFAFAIAALISGDTGSLWIRSVRRWTLVTWMFLSIGIILGGWWAYQELGWGGYWAWDPVENASFMPWLTGTAFIHSILIQEKRDMLKTWNMVLIILTFSLVIFGTFLTRSGVMSSVHSFTASSLGPLFLGFVFFLLASSFALLAWRYSSLKSDSKIQSISSRESGFVFNNVLFVVLCFAVFWGTMFPVLTEAVQGTKITVGPPFFNQIVTPIALGLLLLTGVGPMLVWRKTSRSSFFRNFPVPVFIGLVTAIILIIMGYSGSIVMTVSLSGFVATAIFLEFGRGMNIRRKKLGESYASALMKMISRNRSRYGGYIAHIGIVVMFLGFAGKVFDQEAEWGLRKGEEGHLAGYRFSLVQLSEAERPNHYAWIAEINVENSEGQKVTTLYPEKRVYFHNNPNPDRRQPHSELDIHSTLRRDIYSVFSAVDTESGTAFMKIMINPLVRLVWIGGMILVFGTLIALWPVKQED